MSISSRRKKERMCSKFLTLFICLILAIIPTIIVFQGVSSDSQPIQLVAPSAQVPCLALGGTGVLSLAMYVVVWCSIAREKVEYAKFGMLIMVAVSVFTGVCALAIGLISLGNYELLVHSINHTETEMRNLLQSSMDGLNGIQKSLQCCGVDHYTDWNANPDFKCEEPLKKHSCAIPETCCKSEIMEPSADTFHLRLMYVQAIRKPGHCGREALKPFVGMAYNKPTSTSFKSMTKSVVLEAGCLQKSQKFLSAFGIRNLALAGVILASQILCLLVIIRFNGLIRRDIASREEAMTRANFRRAIRRNALSRQRRLRQNRVDIPRNIELIEMNPSVNVPTGTESETEFIMPERRIDMETRESSAARNLAEIESRDHLAPASNRRRGRAALACLNHTGARKSPVLASRKSVKPGKSAAATNRLTDTERMEGATSSNLFEPRSTAAYYSPTDVGSRRDLFESEWKPWAPENSPIYARISSVLKKKAEDRPAARKESDAPDEMPEPFACWWDDSFDVPSKV